LIHARQPCSVAADRRRARLRTQPLADRRSRRNRRGARLHLVAPTGVYQLTPLKNVCLRHCRSPAEFLSAPWRRGTSAALRMGVDHGAYCVGCCWLLMGLLFAVGVMNLLWVAALAVFVLLEKLVPRGELLARISGVALIAWAAYLVLELSLTRT
jgi:predicted metal-binding membrane protein